MNACGVMRIARSVKNQAVSAYPAMKECSWKCCTSDLTIISNNMSKLVRVRQIFNIAQLIIQRS